MLDAKKRVIYSFGKILVKLEQNLQSPKSKFVFGRHLEKIVKHPLTFISVSASKKHIRFQIIYLQQVISSINH